MHIILLVFYGGDIVRRNKRICTKFVRPREMIYCLFDHHVTDADFCLFKLKTGQQTTSDTGNLCGNFRKLCAFAEFLFPY